MLKGYVFVGDAKKIYDFSSHQRITCACLVTTGTRFYINH